MAIMVTTSLCSSLSSVVRGHHGQVVVCGQVQCSITSIVAAVHGHPCSWSSTV